MSNTLEMRRLAVVIALIFIFAACASTPTNGKPAYTCGPVMATTKAFFNNGNHRTAKLCSVAWSGFSDHLPWSLIVAPFNAIGCPVMAGLIYVGYLAWGTFFIPLASFGAERLQQIECPRPGEEPVPAPWKV